MIVITIGKYDRHNWYTNTNHYIDDKNFGTSFLYMNHRSQLLESRKTDNYGYRRGILKYDYNFIDYEPIFFVKGKTICNPKVIHIWITYAFNSHGTIFSPRLHAEAVLPI